MSQLRQRQAELERLGVRVVVVTFEDDSFARAYVEETGLGWPLLVDSERRLYRAYGMERGGWWDVFGPAAWWKYLKLLLRGRRMKRGDGDVRQLGGDVLVDPEGVVRLHRVGSGPADRPTVDEVLEKLRS